MNVSAHQFFDYPYLYCEVLFDFWFYHIFWLSFSVHCLWSYLYMLYIVLFPGDDDGHMGHWLLGLGLQYNYSMDHRDTSMVFDLM